MDVHAQLAEIRQALEQARSMPMSASVVVNREELLSSVERLEAAIEDALVEARRIREHRDDVVAEGRREAERLVDEARDEQERLVSDTEVFRLARVRADELLVRARAEADELRRETDEYVDERLAGLEVSLARTMETVRRGRERLAGRSAAESPDGRGLDSRLEPA